MQLDTVADALPKIDALLASDGQYLLGDDKDNMAKIVDGLRSGDRDQIGAALLLLNKDITRSTQTMSLSYNYPDLLRKIYDLLGKPEPMMLPGQGFGAAYEQAPSKKKVWLIHLFIHKWACSKPQNHRLLSSSNALWARR